MYLYIEQCENSLGKVKQETQALVHTASQLPLCFWDSRALSPHTEFCYNPLIFLHSIKFPLLNFIGLFPLGYSDQLCSVLFIPFNHQ